MANYVPLRDRDDLSDEVRQVLSVRRHAGRPWTEEDALVVARWRGYEPSGPWPGSVGVAWPGVCELGHDCKPHFGQVLAGRPPCSRTGHKSEDPGPRTTPKRLNVEQRKAQTVEEVTRIAVERGHVVHEVAQRATASGAIGKIRKTFLTVEYECGHQSENLAIPADRYITRNGGGCSVCRPNKLIPGVNELLRVRPDLVGDLVDPSLASKLTYGSWTKVSWRCSDCGNKWEAAVASRTLLGSGCPECHGGGGYDQEAPGTLYVIKGTSKITSEVLVKVGISNVPAARLYRHHRQGLRDVLVSATWSDGSVPVRVEAFWKWTLRSALPDALHATKTDLMDGYREAVRDSDESWQSVSRLLAFARAQSPETLTEWEEVPGLDDRRSTSFDHE